MAKHILAIGATGKLLDSSLLVYNKSDNVSGPSGIEFCHAALAQGHQLTLYVRSPGKLPASVASSEKVSLLEGALEEKASLERAIASGATIFVSFAGPVPSSKGTVGYNIMRHGTLRDINERYSLSLMR